MWLVNTYIYCYQYKMIILYICSIKIWEYIALHYFKPWKKEQWILWYNFILGLEYERDWQELWNIFILYTRQRVKRRPRDCSTTVPSAPSRCYKPGTVSIVRCRDHYTIVLTESKIGHLAMTFHALYSLRFKNIGICWTLKLTKQKKEKKKNKHYQAINN